MSCLSLFRLSARISQKPHVETSWNTPCMLPAAVARFSSEGVALRYVLSVSLMTSCLPIIDRATATQAGCDYVTHQGHHRSKGEVWCLWLSCFDVACTFDMYAVDFFTYLQPICNHYCDNLFLWGQVLPFPLPLLPILLLYSPPVHLHSR